jgi:hypothetical protein
VFDVQVFELVMNLIVPKFRFPAKVHPLPFYPEWIDSNPYPKQQVLNAQQYQTVTDSVKDQVQFVKTPGFSLLRCHRK